MLHWLPSYLQTNIIAQMLSIGGQGANEVTKVPSNGADTDVYTGHHVYIIANTDQLNMTTSLLATPHTHTHNLCRTA